jgi:DtxR family Mn-dependent transcriptional regulator
MNQTSQHKYLRAIYQLTERDQERASTSQIAQVLKVSPPSVTEMLDKLGADDLVSVEKYYGTQLTPSGRQIAVTLVRKQRIWETFLHQKLKISWVDLAEQAAALSANSDQEVSRRLSIYLNEPKWNPYGEPIPNEEGKISIRTQSALSDIPTHQPCTLLATRRKDKDFLTYLSSINLQIGRTITVLSRQAYEGATKIAIKPTDQVHTISSETAAYLLVRKL